MDKNPSDNTKTTTKTPANTQGADNLVESPNITIDKDDVVTSGVTVTEEPVTVVVKPPKKNKTGAILTIIILILFLIGGGCFVFWFFIVYHSPENIAYSAVKQLITADNVAISGTVSLASAQSNSNGNTTKIELTFGAINNHLPTSTTATFSISERDQQDKIVSNHEVAGMLATTVMKDGVFYFKLSAGEALDLIAEETDLDEADYGDLVLAIFDVLSDEWWQVSLVDILDEFDFSNSESRAITNFYDCLLDTINTNYSDEFLDLYNQYKFVNISKSDQPASEGGRSLYDLKLDYVALTNFVNVVPETNMAESLYACYNDAARRLNGANFDEFSAFDVPEISVSNMRNLIPEDLDIKLEISDIDRRLTGIIGKQYSRQRNLDVKFEFQYFDQLTPVSAPDEYRSVTDLATEITEIVMEYFMGDNELDPGFSFNDDDDCDPDTDCSSIWQIDA